MITSDAAARALFLLCYQDDVEIATYFERFASRYGTLSLDSVLAALARGDSLERLFAIFLLGMSDDPEQRAHVRPFLASDDPWEQWPSALCLGVARDPEVFPLICSLLTAQWPTNPDFRQAGSGYIMMWRPYLARLLGEWGHPEAVAPLRQALVTVLDLSEEEWDHYDLAEFTDEVVFALGRLQAIGVLTGIQAPTAQIDLWRIHMCVGSLFGHYPMPPHAFWLRGEPSEALRAVWKALEGQWGITREQASGALRRYDGWKVEARYQAEIIEHRSMLDLSGPNMSP
jgi:hypothetical protein